ncbi:MAG: T9SS type A sorting domain-containing protein [Bacteroidetes bacterium]|nr:T9SS type A sorting domain-containing protein [Bacteroidota bacterium]
MGVEHAQLCVYSMSGQKLNSLNLNTRQLQQKINIDSLADGLYLVGIEYGALTLGFKRISVIQQ